MDQQKDGVEEIVSLFNLYEQKMYGIAFSILNDSYLAEDAVMDAFVRLLEKQYRIDDPASDASKKPDHPGDTSCGDRPLPEEQTGAGTDEPFG